MRCVAFDGFDQLGELIGELLWEDELFGTLDRVEMPRDVFDTCRRITRTQPALAQRNERSRIPAPRCRVHGMRAVALLASEIDNQRRDEMRIQRVARVPGNGCELRSELFHL